MGKQGELRTPHSPAMAAVVPAASPTTHSSHLPGDTAVWPTVSSRTATSGPKRKQPQRFRSSLPLHSPVSGMSSSFGWRHQGSSTFVVRA